MKAKQAVLLVSALFILLTSLHCQKKMEVSKSTEENKAFVCRLVDEAWNKGNLAVIDELLSPEYVLHMPSPEAQSDLEGYKQAVSMHRHDSGCHWGKI